MVCSPQPVALKSAANAMMKRLNSLNDYSTHTTDIDKELENFRIQRDVAIAAMGHVSLTAVPTETPEQERQRLLRLKQQAVHKLRRIDRGRRSWAYGLKSGDLGAASHGDCDEGDSKLGLCGVTVPSPGQAALRIEEAKVNEALTEKEKRNDAERAKVVASINQKRLERARGLMVKLSKTDALIDEMVHHAVKISQMAPHAPDTTD